MKAGRRFRAELTEAQARLAQQTADVCRAVWNTGLEQRREYRRRGAWMNYEEQAHELVEAKKEHIWLTEAPSHCLQQALRDLDEACRRHGTFNVRWRSAPVGAGLSVSGGLQDGAGEAEPAQGSGEAAQTGVGEVPRFAQFGG
jgi:hypothetical protein